MRVTAETKEATRRSILAAAQELFRTEGYEATTTRDIARAAGIATGTLFNYFATKEAIVTALAMDLLSRSDSVDSLGRYATLDEALFAQVATALRQLKPLRKYFAPVLETALSPLTGFTDSEVQSSLRTNHLETVVAFARQHGMQASLTPMALQMYWTLYLGVLWFWTTDKSPRQEDTLALLDQSLEMFVGWLGGEERQSTSQTRNPSCP